MQYNLVHWKISPESWATVTSVIFSNLKVMLPVYVYWMKINLTVKFDPWKKWPSTITELPIKKLVVPLEWFSVISQDPSILYLSIILNMLYLCGRVLKYNFGIIFEKKKKFDACAATGRFLGDTSPYGSVKRLRCDNGDEFSNSKFNDLMLKNKINESFHVNFRASKTAQVKAAGVLCLTWHVFRFSKQSSPNICRISENISLCIQKIHISKLADKTHKQRLIALMSAQSA